MRAGVISTARKQKITANTIFRLHLKLMCECFVVGPPVIILLFPTLGTAVLVETRYLYNNKEYIDYTSSCSIASEISVTGLTCIAGTSCYNKSEIIKPNLLEFYCLIFCSLAVKCFRNVHKVRKLIPALFPHFLSASF